MQFKDFPINKKYSVIYADPPWQYGSKAYQLGNSGKDGYRRGKSMTHYMDVMSIKAIKELPVKDITTDNAVCFMWCTDSHLPEGIEVLKAWGFKYKTIAFNWIKYYESGTPVVNVAPWTLKSWEICLLGVKGSMTKEKLNNSVLGLVRTIRREHARKPDQVRNRIDQMFGHLPRIELFARNHSKGWDVWGNETSMYDKKESK